MSDLNKSAPILRRTLIRTHALPNDYVHAPALSSALQVVKFVAAIAKENERDEAARKKVKRTYFCQLVRA